MEKNQKRGRLLILGLIVLVFIAFSSYFVSAAGCCYGELIGCVDGVIESGTCINGMQGTPDQPNTFVDKTICDGLVDTNGVNICEDVCCCTTYPAKSSEQKQNIQCSGDYKQIKPLESGKSCDEVCEVYQMCEYTSCEQKNLITTPACYCKPGFQTSESKPFCCADDGLDTNGEIISDYSPSYIYSDSNQCPSICKTDYNFNIMGYVLDENDNGIVDVKVYLDNSVESITDEEGYFYFGDLDKPKSYDLKGVKSGYEQIELSVFAKVVGDTPQNVVGGYNLVNITLKVADIETEIGDAKCADGSDNDNDGYYDKCDADCNTKYNIESMLGLKSESSETSCIDGKDNDCDTYIDCADDDCDGVGDCVTGTCGDDQIQHPEECDGESDSICPNSCQSDCTCELVCGNGFLQSDPESNYYEQCDAVYVNGELDYGYDLPCPGLCVTPSEHDPDNGLVQCQCKPTTETCGNDIIQGKEQCDGNKLGVCDTGCCSKEDPYPCKPCECKDPFICGDGVVDLLEECDAIYDSSGDIENGNDDLCKEYMDEEIDFYGFSKYNGKCNPRNSDDECKCTLTCTPVTESKKQKLVELNANVISHQIPITLKWSFKNYNNVGTNYCNPDYTNVFRCDASSQISETFTYEQRLSTAKSYCGGDNSKWTPIGANINIKTLQDPLTENDYEKVYCYKAKSYYNSNPDLDLISNMVCVPIGQKACFELSKKPMDEFCLLKTGSDGKSKRKIRARCYEPEDDEKSEDGESFINFIKVEKDCDEYQEEPGEEFFCIGPDSNSDTFCKHQAPCYQCTDPFGLFYISRDTSVTDSVSIVQVREGTLNTKSEVCSQLETCYLDYSDSIVDKYDACSNVKSCYDYRSERACAGIDKIIGTSVIGDKCQVGGEGGCEWEESDHLEFGIGVCRPVDINQQDCDRCNYPFNDFFGKCNDNLCRSYGEDCFYSTGSDNALDWQCIDKKDLGCEDYGNNRNYCINSNEDLDVANHTLDIAYQDISGEYSRVSGSHKTLGLSNDYMELGKCKWIETSDPDDLMTESECIKDSDGNDKDDCSDLNTNNLNSITKQECKKDMEPPTTYFSDIKILKGDADVFFSVTDKISSTEMIETRYSIYPEKGTFVYPSSWANKVEKRIKVDVEDSGYYNLTYFSFDEARNFEEVKTIDHIYIDASPPTVTVIFDYKSYEKEIDNGEAGKEYEWLSNLQINVSAVDGQDLRTKCTTNLFYYDLDNKMDVTDSIGGLTDNLVSNDDEDPSKIYYNDLSDDIYYFTFDCYDKSGNHNSNSNDEIIIRLEGDTFITNIKPDPKPIRLTGNSGSNVVKLSLDTMRPATCRYDSYTENNYYDMKYTFEHVNGDPTRHAIDSPDFGSRDLFYVNYNVLCEFDDDKIYGNNNGDKIVFSIDNKAPVTTTTFDKSWHHLEGNDDVPVELVCNDEEVPNNKKPSNFGCKEIRYCVGVGCNPDDVFKGNVCSGYDLQSCVVSFDNSGITILRYYSIDKGGNKEDIKNLDIKIAKNPPKVDIIILDILTGEEVDRVSRVGSPSYLVKIKSTKDLLTSPNGITYLKFVLNNEEHSLKMPLPIGDRKSWQTILTLSPELRNKFGNAQFLISYIDEHGYQKSTIENGEFFVIDTEPPIKPTLKPFGDKYDQLYSTLRKMGSKYYTNKPVLVLSGFTSITDPLLWVYFYLSSFGEQYGREQIYQELDNENSAVVLTSDTLGTSEDKLKVESVENVNVGEYVNLFDRYDYGNYSKLYRIDGIDSGSKILTLGTKSPKSLRSGFKGFIYKTPILKEWFYSNIAFETGKNYMKLRGQESFFVKSDYTNIYNVFYDSSSPELLTAFYVINNKKYPLIGSTINNPTAKIFVQIKEMKKSSGFDRDKLLFSVDDGINKFSNKEDYNSDFFNIEDDSSVSAGISYKNYNIINLMYNRRIPVAKEIKFELDSDDKSNNNLLYQFSTIYHPSYPSAPKEFLVDEANCYYFTCFRKTEPGEIKVKFDSEVSDFSTHYSEFELQSPTSDHKLFTIITNDLVNKVSATSLGIASALDNDDENIQYITVTNDNSDNFEFNYYNPNNDYNSKSNYNKRVGFEFKNFDALNYYKIFVNDVYIMKTRADGLGILRFKYDLLGTSRYNFKVQPFNEKVYPLTFKARKPDKSLMGMWTYYLVVDSEEPNIVYDNVIEGSSDSFVMIKAEVDNENFDLNGTLVIDSFKINEGDDEAEAVIPKQVSTLWQVSNTEFAREFFIPKEVVDETQIPYAITLVDRAGNIKTVNGVIKIDNKVSDIIITEIILDTKGTGLGDNEKVIERLIENEGLGEINGFNENNKEFFLKDLDDDVIIKGKAEAVSELYLYNLTDKSKIDFLDDDGNFEFGIKLISFPNIFYRNELIFEMKKSSTSGKQPRYKIIVINTDKEPPANPNIVFDNSQQQDIVSEHEGVVSEQNIIIVTEPLIIANIEYNEPVELVNYKIVDEDVEFDKQGDVTDKFVLTAQSSMPNTDINPFVLEINAKDEFGNEQLIPSEKQFYVYAGKTKIDLINPRHRVSTKERFTLKIRTTRESKCKYSEESFVKGSSYDFSKGAAFRTVENKPALFHEVPGFTILGDGVLNTLYVLCDDESEEYISEMYSDLRVDKESPKISSINVSKSIINSGDAETDILVQVNEPSICKYGVENKYGEMDWFDDESINNELSYKILHTQTIQVSKEEKQYTYYVQCEDLAGLKTEFKDIDFEVKKQGLEIEILEPQEAISRLYPVFKVKTNQIARCYYKNHNDKKEGLKEMGRSNGALIHEDGTTYPPFEPGKYTYKFTCTATDPISTLTPEQTTKEIIYNFAIDDTPAVLTKMDVVNKQFCPGDDGKYSITINVDAIDPESGILGYNYSLEDYYSRSMAEEKFTSSKQIIISNLNLSKNSAYKAYVIPINKAGMRVKDSINYTSEMSVFTKDTAECINDKNGPTISVEQLSTSSGILVKLACYDDNSCNSDGFNYGVGGDENNCKPENAYNPESGILLTQETYICWFVKDQLGNPTAGGKTIKITDSDKDNVPDEMDKCPDTPLGETVFTEGDNIGCSQSQIEEDDDEDAVADFEDICLDTPKGEEVFKQGDYLGCSEKQKQKLIERGDGDNDGVINKFDECPNTPYGEIVNDLGCSTTGPDPEAPIGFWAWFTGIVLLGGLGTGGFFAYQKYPEMFTGLMGKFKKTPPKRTKVGGPSLSDYKRTKQPVREVSSNYAEQQLALRRRQRLKQKRKSIRNKGRSMLDTFDRKPKK